ncbi:uncharacterized protein LOC109594598 [Aethina tumida]|uniref:uncharacterized protein LOC109594598 n=1 Tax=Aethina tumida TaxID=116153 RepID=UPI00096AF4BE|nr:uncharacterized protein LOC109594598 [Aethina tumida]
MLFSKHGKIAIGWALCTVGGISLFYLSKKSIDQRRYESMKVRERMRQSNLGEYEASYRKFSSN